MKILITIEHSYVVVNYQLQQRLPAMALHHDAKQNVLVTIIV